MSYPGSKGQTGTWQRILGQLPPHSVYVEPFAGSAQIFRRKAPAPRSILIDMDLTAVADLRGRAELIQGDALQILPRLALPADAVVYADPPYLLSTRRGRRYYRHEMTDDHHFCLLALLQALPCRVLLSGYPSELYGAALQGWRCISYQTRTRGRTLTECLWCNFPEPAALSDHRWAGLDYRQRYNLRRFVRRWLSRIEAMPPRRRQFVQAELRAALLE